jgi:hypothetical protein
MIQDLPIRIDGLRGAELWPSGYPLAEPHGPGEETP